MMGDGRFWARTKIDGECLVWTGSTVQNARGEPTYGKYQSRGHEFLAHRYAWEQAHGSIPDGLLVCHRCDNPPCVRPDHLFLGTHSDNLRDAIQKGRKSAPPVRRGERHHAVKLTDAEVGQIRSLLATGMRHVDIGARYGVARSTISEINTGRKWRHDGE